MGASEWESTVVRAAGGAAPDGQGAMAEHALLEASLVDAAVVADLPELDRIGGCLAENVRTQRSLCKILVPEFPLRQWTALFGAHVGLFIESTRLRLSPLGPDRAQWRRCEARRRENTLALAALTAEWL